MRFQFSMEGSATTIVVLVLAASSCLTIVGCSMGSSPQSQVPDYASKLADSPPKLAAVHRQANELLPSNSDSLKERIVNLRGYPVVVNVWASWCAPCLAELPYLQQASAMYGRRVAFLGVNSEDDREAANTLLRDFPLSYPSYFDPSSAIAKSLGVSHGLPTTVFFDKAGEQVFTKPGQYPDLRSMKSDIETHALGRVNSAS